MKKIESMCMAVAVVFGMGLSPSPAAEPKPIAVLAVASYNDLISDVNFAGSLVERPQLGATIEGLLAMVTQGKGLAGVDRTRPWGVIIQAGGEKNFTGYAFLPVTDFKEALGLLKLYFTVDSGDGIYKLTPTSGEKVSYVKQQGAWAMFADKPEVLAQASGDPLAAAGKLEKDFIVAGRLFLANVPAELREKFLSQVKQGLQQAAARHGDESSEVHAGRQKLIDLAEPYLTRVLNELDQVVFSWGLDRTAEKVSADVSVTAKPGTKTAEEMGLAAKAMTNLTGFQIPGAALTAAWAGTMPAAKREIASSLIEFLRGKGLADIEKKMPESRRASTKEAINDGADLLQKIVKSGHVDGADTLLFGSSGATGLLAGYVADGALLDKILHTVAKAVVEEHPEAAQFVQLDAEKSDSINFHKISIPIPKDAKNREILVQLVGEKFDFVIGVGQETAYLAMGRDAMASLKTAIDASTRAGAKAVLPLEFSMAMKPLVAFAATAGKAKDRQNAAMSEAELEKTPGKDHIGLTVRPISNGVQVRLEVEQGVLRLFGRLVLANMQP